MRSRRTIYVCIAIIALVSGAVVAGWFLMPSRITETAFEQLRKGMTEDEVEQILGGPGNNVEEWMGQRDIAHVDERGFGGLKIWKESGRTIIVEYDGGRVRAVIFTDAPLRERMRAWYRGDASLLIAMDPESPVRVRKME